jgi:[protein-PII] uridylyltransferase
MGQPSRVQQMGALMPPEDDLRAQLARARESIEARHRGAGAGGAEIAAELTAMCDEVLRAAFLAPLSALAPAAKKAIGRDLALVAVGGYGRGELAPGSDVDLLFLTSPDAQGAKELIARIVRALWDAGLSLSQSVRTPEDCVAAAQSDLTAWTALLEPRLVVGSEQLFHDLLRKLRRVNGRSSLGRFLELACAERAKEYQDYYTPTVYLLEPNIKKSPGGLRDVHLLRWVALLRFSSAELRDFPPYLRKPEAAAVQSCREWLLRIRNELHFHARAAQDVLTLDEQVRVAQWLGYEDAGGLLAVERFMQSYYQRTGQLHEAVTRFLERCAPRSRVRAAVRKLLVRHVEAHFLTDGERIWIDPRSEAAVLASAELLLRLFELARGYSVQVAEEALEAIRAAVPDCEMTLDARRFFLHMLASPPGLGELLRNLHRVGLLSRMLPEFEHARCLIQFNEYHKYTVDEHSIRAVESAVARLEDAGMLGRTYRELHRKEILHLAILLHDLGKGYGEDHCEVGRRLAVSAAAEFGLSEEATRMLVLLVHQHLFMAQIAFRRNPADPSTLVQFARAVATPEVLRMLYVLTAADTEAVAPGNWTAWKESLLSDLYVRAVEELTDSSPAAEEPQRVEAMRRDLADELADTFPRDWLQAQLEAMPGAYLLDTPPARVAGHLRILQQMDLSSAAPPPQASDVTCEERPPSTVAAPCVSIRANGDSAGVARTNEGSCAPSRRVCVQSEFLPETGASVYTVFTRDDLTPGIFSKIAGVLAAAGLQIISAQVITRSDAVVLDTFTGIDLDYAGEPPIARRSEIAHRIEEVLLGRLNVESLFRTRMSAGRSIPAGPSKVEIDNESSDRFTIVEVFAEDRQGLLYVITRTLLELGLSVHSARISTHLDQAVDAFYITTREGEKLRVEAEGAAIRRALLARINGVPEENVNRQDAKHASNRR